MLAVAGGFMIGLAASRFLKASAERRSLSGGGEVNGGPHADLEGSSPAPAQHFGHAEGAV
jgi:hypothetical protein